MEAKSRVAVGKLETQKNWWYKSQSDIKGLHISYGLYFSGEAELI